MTYEDFLQSAEGIVEKTRGHLVMSGVLDPEQQLHCCFYLVDLKPQHLRRLAARLLVLAEEIESASEIEAALADVLRSWAKGEG